MKFVKINFPVILFLTALALLGAEARQNGPIKVACIGNSITYGSGIKEREHYAYPFQLQRMLGPGWEVKNFGVSGRTLLKNGDYPYWNEKALAEAKNYSPDVVIIKLGTNDTKPWNWRFKDQFVQDYIDLIGELKNTGSRPKIYLCIPVPAFPGEWGIRDSIITADIIPAIGRIGDLTGAGVIDLYSPFIGKPEYFPDKVHPGEDGSREIARVIYRRLCRDFNLVPEPEPIPPIPSIRQLAWHEDEYYGFLHFTVNTFTDKEWGYGDEPESVFAPTDFDADEIARNIKAAGMSGVILTAKHHDGFCLWSSAYTGHSVSNSPWKNGTGDMVRELSDACKKHGLKFGVYLSPWDRNNKDYGKPEYLAYYRNQLRELLTRYGEISEVWFDGANGGDGYYGGANETRTIDRRLYYGWGETWEMVRALQPGAVIFSDVGPDVRWVGNESGYAGETCWSTYSPRGEKDDVPAPGYTKYQEATEGHPDGSLWLPAECDVSIRPGWFYHGREDTLVKSPQELFDIYLKSVGRNGSLLLNVPPDRRGRLHDNDLRSLMEFKRIRDSVFSRDLAEGAEAAASNVRAGDSRFTAGNVTDRDEDSYWATDDSVREASLTIDLGKTARVEYIVIREHIQLGQRVEAFTIEGRLGGAWKKIWSGTTIGRKRIIPLPRQEVSGIKLIIGKSKGSPLISEIGIY